MNIGIVGTGHVAASLGKVWAAAGHHILFGSRSPDKAAAAARTAGENAEGGTYAQAFQFGDVIVLAVPYGSMREILETQNDLDGKILVDPSNPVGRDGLIVGHTTSAAEQIAEWAPHTRVVKAFNTIGADSMAGMHGSEDTAFICGDDAEARELVMRLAADLGFEGVDAGPLRSARLLEPLGALWIHLAYRQGLGPGIAFQLLQR
ncbi:MAG: NADPH-dependent F420 reductase [Chloroflexi bacterium]|nr:NADPH-dependent F420 reductase [Chloroflexota bacterium]